ncbi:hypothetical protein BKM31_31635 [[Actinomadura] parvosata subsp. kistnae]|uniref:Uncharacterized protein n=1 Tax=[Actinomadura] parvosata subsp. kistnae TaxID=1909395 RepID=A0A1V0A5H6_9ACTN|nr:hypothetical protein BKM31_31635 [Nonomuraea sp. ATCC 55076]
MSASASGCSSTNVTIARGERLQQHPGALPQERAGHQREQRVTLGVAQPGAPVELRVVPYRLAAPGQLQRHIMRPEMGEKRWGVHGIRVQE